MMYIDLFKTIFLTFLCLFLRCFVLIRYVELASFRNIGADRNNGGHRNTCLGEIVHCNKWQTCEDILYVRSHSLILFSFIIILLFCYLSGMLPQPPLEEEGFQNSWQLLENACLFID